MASKAYRKPSKTAPRLRQELGWWHPALQGPHLQPSSPRDPPQLPVYSPVMDNLPVHTIKAWTALRVRRLTTLEADALRLPEAV